MACGGCLPRDVEVGGALHRSNLSAGVVGEANVIGDMGKGLAMFALARMDLGYGRSNWQLVYNPFLLWGQGSLH